MTKLKGGYVGIAGLTKHDIHSYIDSKRARKLVQEFQI